MIDFIFFIVLTVVSIVLLCLGVVIIFSAIQSTYRALTGKKNISDNKRINELEKRVEVLENE